MDGETLEAAWDAFGEAYLSFCPSHQADLLRKLMATAAKAEHLSVLEVENRLEMLTDSYQSGSNTVQSSESNPETIPLEN